MIYLNICIYDIFNIYLYDIFKHPILFFPNSEKPYFDFSSEAFILDICSFLVFPSSELQLIHVFFVCTNLPFQVVASPALSRVLSLPYASYYMYVFLMDYDDISNFCLQFQKKTNWDLSVGRISHLISSVPSVSSTLDNFYALILLWVLLNPYIFY